MRYLELTAEDILQEGDECKEWVILAWHPYWENVGTHTWGKSPEPWLSR